jgi:NAD(P)-dependent dehydrogenase (short-subunit alcohol dehydrogenase family)
VDLGLEDSVSVISGGTGSIGKAVAGLLLAEGSRVLLVGRRQERLEEVRHGLGGDERDIVLLAADVTADETPAQLRDTVFDAFGRIDVLVNAAESSRFASLEADALEPWYAQWEINVMAPKRLMDTLAPALAESDRGMIVNVTSSAGRQASATNAAYAVAKRGQLALTEVYSRALASSGVRVVAVAAGPTATPLWLEPGRRLDELAASACIGRAQTLADVEERLPVGRLATPDEVAAVVLAAIAGLCGDGVVLPVGGGHVSETYP